MLGEETDPVLVGWVPDLPDWDKRTKLAFEREMLGLYVRITRCRAWSTSSGAERDVGIGELLADDGQREGMVTIAGMITSVTREDNERGDLWAVMTVEDLEASIEVLLFPKRTSLVSTVRPMTRWCKVKGRIKVDDEAVTLNAAGAEPA